MDTCGIHEPVNQHTNIEVNLYVTAGLYISKQVFALCLSEGQIGLFPSVCFQTPFLVALSKHEVTIPGCKHRVLSSAVVAAPGAMDLLLRLGGLNGATLTHALMGGLADVHVH